MVREKCIQSKNRFISFQELQRTKSFDNFKSLHPFLINDCDKKQSLRTNMYAVSTLSNIHETRRASLVSNSYFFYMTEGSKVKDGGCRMRDKDGG